MDVNEMLNTMRQHEGIMNTPMNAIRRFRKFGGSVVHGLRDVVHDVARNKDDGFIRGTIRLSMTVARDFPGIVRNGVNAAMSLNEFGSTGVPVSSGTKSVSYDGTDFEDGVRLTMQGVSRALMPVSVLKTTTGIFAGRDSIGRFAFAGMESVAARYGGRGTEERMRQHVREDMGLDR